MSSENINERVAGVIMGVDYGLKRVGLAVCDEGCRVAVGAGWVEGLSGRSLARRIRTEAERRRAKLVVVGQPPSGGRDSSLVAAGAANLAAALERMGIRTERYAEDYTTAAVLADRRKFGGKSHKPKGWVDEAAAILILQGYIDMMKPTDGKGTTGQSQQRSSTEE